MYQLEIPNQPRDKPQPKIVLLECRVKGLEHDFLHWSWPGPSVTFQVSKVTVLDNDLCKILLGIPKI